MGNVKWEMLNCVEFGFHCFNQGILGHGFGFQGGKDPLVDGVAGDDMLDGDGALLALTVEAAVGLGVEFERPSEAEPDKVAATLLEVQAVTGRGGMDQANLELAGVPF